MTFGATLRARRRRLKLSLQQVAGPAGMTKAHLWSLEQGRSVNPTVQTLRGLSAALGLSPVTLFRKALEDSKP